MKITTFDPYILVKNAEPLVQLFGELVQSADLPRESLTGIRVNVDDFDEAYELLTSRGFKKAPGTDIVDTGSAKALLMIAPSGFLLELIQHIKK